MEDTDQIEFQVGAMLGHHLDARDFYDLPVVRLHPVLTPSQRWRASYCPPPTEPPDQDGYQY